MRGGRQIDRPEVTEDYRWLEDWSAPEVKAWSAAQNTYARGYLDGLTNRVQVEASVRGILEKQSVSYRSVGVVAGKVFAIKKQPPKQQPFLVVMNSLEAPESATVLVDPNAMDDKGLTSIDWYVPSPDASHVAVSISKGGTESGDVSIFEVATGKKVFETLTRVNGGTAGGDLAWNPDGNSFFYTRYPRTGERPEADLKFYQQLYLHRLGDNPAKDTYILGKDLPKIGEIRTRVHGASGRLLVTVQKGDGGEFELYLRERDGRLRKFSEFGDGLLAASFGRSNDLYLLSRQGAPRGKVVRIDIEALDPSKGTVLIPETSDTIVEDFWGPPTVLVTPTRIYIDYQLGGPSTIRAFAHDGKAVDGPSIPDVSAVHGLRSAGDDAILFTRASFVDPPAVMHYDPKTKVTTKTALASESPVDLSKITVVREFATSKDGTKIPINILLPPSIDKNGRNPTVVYGYGGYGVNITPRFRPWTAALLSRGVIYAVANIRGGGEFGEDWHRQGYLTQKQNVFDDFAAAVQHMIDTKYTSNEKVAILGGSNGGLLMGATLTQHPAMPKAVVSLVGIYDMLRVELSSNGQFNITEFGTVANKNHFDAMYAYSPYHRIKNGTAYPATLFLTGENDPRVDPMQSRKMTARLQAANAGSSRILLRTSSDAGHGAQTGLSEQIAQYTDIVAFLLEKLGA
nr:prolyl endopeptidase-like [Nerophis lumbriciformis]